jgi:hypothetical protein
VGTCPSNRTAPCVRTERVIITINGDVDVESDETFFLD